MKEQVKSKTTLVNIQPIPARTRREVVKDFPQGLRRMMESVMNEVITTGGTIAGPPMVLYYDQVWDLTKVDLEVVWPVAGPDQANGIVPAVTAAKYVHVGPYDSLTPVYEAMFEWIAEHGYRPLCPVREVYPNDPGTTPPEQLLTEIILPVEKA